MGAGVTRRPVKKMRRAELEAEAQRLGVKNPHFFIVAELRRLVTSRLGQEAGR